MITTFLLLLLSEVNNMFIENKIHQGELGGGEALPEKKTTIVVQVYGTSTQI